MLFKKIFLMTQIIVLISASTMVWGQTTKAVTKPLSVPFDAQRKPFKDTDAGKAYLKKYGKLPEASDIFGYSMPDNPLRKQRPKNKFIRSKKRIVIPVLKPGPKVLPKKFNPNKKSSFFKVIFDFILPSAVAYDEDPNIPGLINCRPDSLPSGNGYFKAYFEDLAFNNGQGSFHGYHDQQFGAARRQAVCDVLSEIAHILKIDELDGPTPEIHFNKDWPADAPTGALASAGSFLGPSSISKSTYSGFLHEHIIRRIDPSNGPDAAVNTNWDETIAWSVDSSLNSGTFDFKSVLRHEILHALGFTSFLPAVTSNTNVATQHNHWDRNLFSPTSGVSGGLVDCSNSQNCTQYLSLSLLPILQIPIGAPSAWFINNSSVYQGKKNYVNAPFDGPRPVFSPSSWIQGSSLSHFDMNRLASLPNGLPYVMHPSISLGEQRNIHDHEKEVLCHLGYQIRDMSGCELRTPVAIDDEGTINNLETHIPLVQNDNPNDNVITNLGVHSIQFLDTSSGIPNITYYSGISSDGLTCSGSSVNISSGSVITAPYTFLVTAPFLVKCLKVDTPSSTNILNFKYKIKDLATNRISDVANVIYSRCETLNGEHVCNGDFEMGTTQNSPTFAFNGYVPFWAHAESYLQNTPDLAVKNWGQNSPYNYVPFTTWFGQTFDMVDSGNYSAAMWVANNDSSERIATKLKLPLVVGQCYKVSLDVSLIKPTGPYSSLADYKIFASFSDQDMRQEAAYDSPAIDSALKIINQSVTVSNGSAAQWYNVSKIFSPAEPYEYLAIYMPNPSYIPYGGFSLISYVDNVSVKKLDLAQCYGNSISGTVYNDINLNGQMNLGEPVLSSVKVKLYDAQGNLINQATTDSSGSYKFYGVSPAQEYNVVLNQESLFQIVTEPLQNSIVSGYQYARNIEFDNGGIITGENFGVILQGQSLVPPLAISISKNCNAVTLSLPLSGSGYTYNWTGPNFTSTSSAPSISAPGEYTVIVNGPNGYINSGTITVSANQFVQITGTINSTSTGVSINTSVSGATPTSYSWTGPNGYTSSQPNATGITSTGTYTVVANYGNNCSVQTSVNFNTSCAEVPPATSFNTTLTSANNVPLFQCYLNTAPNGTSQCLQNIALPSGSASTSWNAACPATVAGTMCCSWKRVCGGTTITEVVTPASNGNNGSINITVEGNNPFTYQWSNGATTEDISSLAPGNYTVTAKNYAGCMTTATFRVHAQMSVNLTKFQGCSVAQNTLTASVTSGAAPYTYRWYKMNGATAVLQTQYTLTNSPNVTQTISGIPAGIYFVQVTDTNGQQVSSTTAQIDAYTAPTVAAVKTDASAPAFNTGSIKATVTGGIGPFNFIFTGANPATFTAQASPYTRTGLSGSDAQTYSVSVTDSKGCSSNTFSGIKVLNKLSATSKAVLDCSSGTNKVRLVAVPVGGHNGYGYVWKQGTTVVATTETFLANLGVAYTLQVNDNSNPQQLTPVINVPAISTLPGMHTVTVAVTSATNSQANGAATVTTTAGLGPYTFTYTPGTVSTGVLTNIDSRAGLAPGAYSVGVKTNFGCTFSKPFTILNSLTTTPAKQ